MSVEAINPPFSTGLLVSAGAQEQVAQSGTPEVASTEPTLRAATFADLEALVRVELGAYPDVYGSNPSQETIDQERAKYSGRISLLGDNIRVIENTERGVYGMIVYCPTSYTRQDFMDLADDADLTSGSTLHSIFDPQGKSAYVVNLAILPEERGKGGDHRLFQDAIQRGIESGIEFAYFKSRLPGFKKWAQTQQDIAFKIDVPPPSLDELAETYWQLTEQRGGESVPTDPLLRFYARLGCTPLRLVNNAWKPDRSSEGYGVLCELKTPERPEAITAPDQPEQRLSFWQGTLKWIKAHRKSLMLGGVAVAGPAYQSTQGGVSEAIHDALAELPWAGPAYGTSWGLLLGGLALMLGGAGRKVNFTNLFNQPKDEWQHIARMLHTEATVKTGFWVNTLGALAAAGVVSTAIIKAGLPVGLGLPGLLFAAADLASTIALRTWAYTYKPKQKE